MERTINVHTRRDGVTEDAIKMGVRGACLFNDAGS